MQINLESLTNQGEEICEKSLFCDPDDDIMKDYKPMQVFLT